MCIACHEMKPKKEMLRVVKDKEGNLSLDFSGKKAGRGAYLCDSAECMAKLKKQRLLNRAFSCEIPEELYRKVEEEFFERD